MQLLQGDCLELMKDIPDKSVDMVLTDPPYLIDYKSNYRQRKYKKIINDKNSYSVIINSLKESERVMKENTAIYVFCSWHNIDFFKIEFEKLFNLKNIIVWSKNNTSMGDLKGSYAPKHELILYGHKGRKLMEGFRHPDVLEAKRTGNKFHPTEKPVELLKTFIESSSKENQVVLDMFMGSGTTGVACKNLNREFIGMELDEGYFNIAKERIENA